MSQEEGVKIEEVKDEEIEKVEEDDDIPDLVEGEGESDTPSAPAQPQSKKVSRGEKKSKKAMQKLGMKPVPGIIRVQIKKQPNVLFVIQNPDVYKSPNSDTYIVFGEAKIEDLNQSAALDAAKQFEQVAGEGASKEAESDNGDSEAKIEEVVEDNEDVDTNGIDAKDIELVTNQTGASTAEAVNAIRAANGDIVNAIMALTK